MFRYALLRAAAAACLVAALDAASASAARAAVVTDFTVNPVQTAGFDPNDGIRQVTAAAELQLPGFDTANDRFRFQLSAFGITGGLNFINAFATQLPTGGVNLVVLRDSDNDANPATPFNAGTAASLIAAALTESTPGFFVYFNSALDVNRLVFSTDLASPTADLAILARILGPTGVDAVAALEDFSARNFAALAETVNPVPEPGALALLGAGLVGLGVARRRCRRKAPTLAAA